MFSSDDYACFSNTDFAFKVVLELSRVGSSQMLCVVLLHDFVAEVIAISGVLYAVLMIDHLIFIPQPSLAQCSSTTSERGLHCACLVNTCAWHVMNPCDVCEIFTIFTNKILFVLISPQALIS